MQTAVVAVVVVHDEPEYFSSTLFARKNQTRSIDQIVVVDTSHTDECSKIAFDNGISSVHRLSPKYSLEQSLAFATKHLGSATWLWLLHDDSAPKPDALAQLLRAVDLSPSVAIAGPKLLNWNNEKLISQMGLTLTRGGDLFSKVNNEIDQSQHDEIEDVMAVGTAAALIRVDVLKQLNGFDPSAPELAADLDFSIRARMSGHRVIVVPQARVLHAALSLNGQRDRSWLGTTTKSALRRSAIHLRLAYSPLPLAILFWIALPALGLIRSIGRLMAKRPDRIWSELSSATWGFMTIFSRLSSRARISRAKVISFSKLDGLRATWQELRNSNRAALEQEQSQATLAAFERGEFEVENQDAGRGFIAAGGLWIALAVSAISFQFFPSNLAAVGGGLLPLSDSWLSLFSRAGASFQPIGLGYFAPSDPFVWVLTLLGATTFWAPSLSLALVLLFAKAIAFAGAWRVVSLITSSNLVRNLAALSFAFWPALSLAQQEARIPAVIAQVLLPWLIFSMARAAGIGKQSFSTQTWSWVAVSGLLFFMVAASAPNIIPVLLVALFLLIATHIRRFGYLIWIPLPTAAVFGPTVVYYLFQIAQPLALLADPGRPQSSTTVSFWQQFLGGATFGFEVAPVGAISSWLAAPVAVFAVLSLLTKRWLLATGLWLSALSLSGLVWLIGNLSFAALGVGSAASTQEFVNGSGAAGLGLFGLLMAVLFAIFLSEFKSVQLRKSVAVLALALTIAPSAAVFALSTPQVRYTDGRVVPSIVAAEAAAGSGLKLLLISPELKSNGEVVFGAEVVSGDGVQLEDVSLSYRFALNSIKQERAEDYQTLAQLVADLASANGADLNKIIALAEVGYVLVPDVSSSIAAQLAISLDSVEELETVGQTDFGRLWRVREPVAVGAEQISGSFWSITKVVQLTVLMGFVLLALPSINQRKRVSGDSDIFVAAGEDSQ
jgi:GT2 family glycosyltransferase